jgi:hypothetical protein
MPLLEHATVRAVNCAENERRKKEKDDAKKKKQRKARAQLDLGKRHQGSEEEEEEEEGEEEEGAYSSGLPIPWEDLANKDGLAGGNASLGDPSCFMWRRKHPHGQRKWNALCHLGLPRRGRA